MKYRSQNVITAFFFLFIIFLIALVLRTQIGGWVQGVFEQGVGTIGKAVFGISRKIKTPLENSSDTTFQEQNKALSEKLAELDTLKKDNAALSDQFQIVTPRSSALLPAHVVSMPRFIPGISFPDVIVVDQGKGAHLREGMGVVVGQNLIGKITRVSENLSEVTLVSNPHFSSAAKTSRTGALGVLHGGGEGELTLDTVLPSEDLRVDDVVITVGDQDFHAVGIPGNIIVGKITSVDKKASAIFQTAKVKSLVDVTKLSIVFVVMENN